MRLQKMALNGTAIFLVTMPLLAQQIARPCCSVSNVNTATGLVAAKVNATGQGFQFTLTNRALTTRLRAGQGVYANFKTMQVSLDGRTVAGAILPAVAGVRPPALPNVVPSIDNEGTASALRAEGVNIAGPVTGGNQTPGAVALSMIALAGGQIHLASNRPDLAAVPAMLPVPQNANRVNFTVKTFPTAMPSDVIISAQFDNGTPAASGTFTVKPPEVSSIACSPGTVISGMPVSCKIVLNGTVAAAPVTIAGRQRSNPQSSGLPVNVTSNSPAAIANPGQVVVLPGKNEASFSVPTIAIPQPDAVTLLAASAAWQTSTQVKLSPAAIRSLTCEGPVLGSPTDCSCHATYPSSVRAHIRLTAPAPQGFQVKLSFSSSAVHLSGTNSNLVDFPTGATYKDAWLQLNPVATPTALTVSAKDPLAGDTKSFSMTIQPPKVADVGFGNIQYCCAAGMSSISNVPLGGQSVPVTLFLDSPVPQSGMTFNAQYSGTTEITGPAHVTASAEPPLIVDRTTFRVNVMPCGVNPPCQVHLSVGGASATLTVNP